MDASGFWGKMSDDYLKDHPEPAALTDELLAAFEKRVGLKLPKALTDLLRIKNGGPLQNNDFRFKGKDYQVTYFKSVAAEESYDSIKTYWTDLDGPDWQEQREALQKRAGDPRKLLLIADPLDYPSSYALNYNKLNAQGEPTVLCIWMEGAEEPEVTEIADSFAEFLAGQYFGDTEPCVDLNEASKYELIAQGGYEGRYAGEPSTEPGLLSGLPIKVQWKICADRERIIVFQESDWAGTITLSREEIEKSALQFDFPSLESHGVDIEPELAELIRGAVEIDVIQQFEADVIPDCYQLLLHVQLGGGSMVKAREAKKFGDRWKNSEDEILYSGVMSASQEELGRVLGKVAKHF